MTMIKRIQDLCKRANGQISLEEKRAESGRLQPLLDETRSLSADLDREVEQIRLLRDQGVRIKDPDAANAARRTLGRLRERFAKERRAEQLTRGKDWNRLEEQVRVTCESLSAALDAEWRKFVETAFSGDKPSNLDRTLAGTPGNIENLRRFRDAYAEIERYAKSRPTGRADFDRVRELARQLTEIHQTFDFSVPDDVKLFLRAVADDGADIALLTADVRDWLKEQGASNQYRIVARNVSQ